MKLRNVAAVFCTVCASSLMAAPQTYSFDHGNSSVGFSYTLGGQPSNGQMPVKDADLEIDLANISASAIDVTLDPAKAKAGIFVATQAMRGDDVLDTRRHPEIRFKSTKITGTIHGAKVTGDLTVRGITKQVTMDAQLFRQAGFEAGDHSHLSVMLTGSLDRHLFGASGYPDLVGPQIDLRILVRMERSTS